MLVNICHSPFSFQIDIGGGRNLNVSAADLYKFVRPSENPPSNGTPTDYPVATGSVTNGHSASPDAEETTQENKGPRNFYVGFIFNVLIKKYYFISLS